MAEHTPTPWKNAYRDENDNTLVIKGNGETRVAYVAPRPHYADNQEANAAFIVRAVNSHAALVEALENALNTIKAADEDYDLNGSYVSGLEVLSQAKAPGEP